ncbi:hypothetical protein BJ138DRAFT_532314 [Hygrophoropsis aurantiaca]|uniref:Uncharacterized protein n=1 Tax=Hygrophoropsis aurantiaca TaxID=72124 RepID=A0ACB8A2H8_9AGAM|nr:hypothetical protein BJ138DRAFT_532314 [Hygrophoropsis aurantiaca]
MFGTDLIDLCGFRPLETTSTLTVTTGANTKLKLTHLPIEVLCEIINNLSAAIDVIRLGQVCRSFRGWMHDQIVWHDRYRESRLPRPPGSRIYQSGLAMAKALVTTTRCHERWISKPRSDRIIHPNIIRLNRFSTRFSRHYTVACGRWLLILSRRDSRILCRDLDSTTTAWPTVYKSDTEISYCSAVTAAPDESGHAQTFVVIAERHRCDSNLGRL